jgi:hypothetical protein
MIRRGLSLVAFCMVGMLGTAAADDDGKQQADKLFEEGRNLLAAGDQNAAAACAKFSEAIKLDPEAPGTMLNLGLCNEKLEKFKTALYWFRKAQARAAETNLPDYENAAKEHTILLKRDKVATIKIAFTGSAPDGTKVKIDDDEVAPADFLAAEVDPGEHTLTASAPGKRNVIQKFNVNDRGGQTLTIEFVDGDNFVVVDRGAGRRKAAIITAAGGGLLMATSGLLSYLWGKEYEKCVKDGSPDLANCPETTLQGAVDYANKYQERAKYVGTTMFVVGAVAVGVAGVLYFTAPEKERVDRTVFAPMVSPTEIGIAASGSF